MAKGNMFLGMARGKVGDVVFYRADGQQLSRVRNRNPRNPRSNAQLFQRAIMATIVQAYTAGKAIFDHSFQGYSVGAQNQREFLKRNAKLLRETVAADINTPITTNQQKGRVVAPGVSSPVPFAYEISSGTYQQTIFTESNLGTTYSLPMINDGDGETAKAYFERVGFTVGDIYTFVMFVPNENVLYQSNLWDDVLASQNACSFGYVRLIVKDASSDETPLTKISQLFEIECVGPFVKSAQDLGDLTLTSFSIESLSVENSGYYTTGALGLIRSRRDQDLRSNSKMLVSYGVDAEDMFGIASDYILDAWKSGTASIGESDLILEGGEG